MNCCRRGCVNVFDNQPRVLDGERAAILRLIASTGVRVLSVDWVTGRVLVEIPPARTVED